MSMMHERALKQSEYKNKELKDNLNFLETMIMKERVNRKNVKESISKHSTEFDLLYAKAQDFIEHSDD